MKESYGTLSEIINGLESEGYDTDFNVKDNCIVCQNTGTILSPNHFEIDKIFRFEGDSSPD
jgi:hypothetical protein